MLGVWIDPVTAQLMMTFSAFLTVFPPLDGVSQAPRHGSEVCRQPRTMGGGRDSHQTLGALDHGAAAQIGRTVLGDHHLDILAGQ
jgi:hypothetical protein